MSWTILQLISNHQIMTKKRNLVYKKESWEINNLIITEHKRRRVTARCTHTLNYVKRYKKHKSCCSASSSFAVSERCEKEPSRMEKPAVIYRKHILNKALLLHAAPRAGCTHSTPSFPQTLCSPSTSLPSSRYFASVFCSNERRPPGQILSLHPQTSSPIRWYAGECQDH